MAMNKYMHPRNIYKEPPNFKQLALEYPEFRKFTTQDISGKITFDFKNVEALRALSCTLLKKDFGINLEIPLNKLIPTIPLRLNYILWVEDLLSLTLYHEHTSTSMKGIDIGTGASCVYPLIAAKKYSWSMIATDIDPESIKYAEQNVKNNSLESFIKVTQVTGDTLLEDALKHHPGDYDFCMCNPPFFASKQELNPFFKARKQNRPHPKNAFCAGLDEVVFDGGEISYITKLIKESQRLSTKIKIYTTMIGQKSSLPPLKTLLKEIDVVSFKQSEFCQGHTTRWGLAWTFHDVDLRKIPDSFIAAKQKQSKPLFYEIDKNGSSRQRFVYISERLVHIFQELQIEFQEVKHISDLIQYIVVAESNTWSHQRRKRRELQKSSNISLSNNIVSEHNSLDVTCDELAQISFNPKKRKIEDESGFYNAKKMKHNDEKPKQSVFLKAIVSVLRIKESIGLKLEFVEGNGTKEALHQILQFIKNKFGEEFT